MLETELKRGRGNRKLELLLPNDFQNSCYCEKLKSGKIKMTFLRFGFFFKTQLRMQEILLE
jgi:hypothetical protein